MIAIPFHTTDWEIVSTSRHAGETGEAIWRTLQYGDLRIRVVNYSANYLADEWCHRGHILFCLEGTMTTELQDGRTFVLKPGMSYQVSDELSAHRSSSQDGVKLLIIDGGFLKREKGLMM